MIRYVDFSYIALTIAFTVYGQMILKWRLSVLEIALPSGTVNKFIVLFKLLFDPFIFSGIAMAFLASLAWMAAMTKFELSFAYPFMAINFVLVFSLSILLLDETYTVAKFIGVSLIILGTIVLARG